MIGGGGGGWGSSIIVYNNRGGGGYPKNNFNIGAGAPGHHWNFFFLKMYPAPRLLVNDRSHMSMDHCVRNKAILFILSYLKQLILYTVLLTVFFLGLLSTSTWSDYGFVAIILCNNLGI